MSAKVLSATTPLHHNRGSDRGHVKKFSELVFSKKLDGGTGEHMADVFHIGVQQHMGELRLLELYNWSVIREILHWHGRSKIFLTRLKDKSWRECDFSIQGWKRPKGEAGQCATLYETEGFSDDMNTTAYIRAGDPTQEPVAILAGQGTLKRKSELLPYSESLTKRPKAGKQTNGRTNVSKCIKFVK